MRLTLLQSSRTLIIILSVMIILVLAIFNFGSWFFINRIEDSLESELETRLRAVASMAAELIQNTEFLNYHTLGREFSAYLIVQPILERLPRQIQVQHVFLIDRSWRTIASSNAVLFPTGLSIPYLIEDSVAVEAAWNGELAASRMRIIAGSRFKSAYAPVANPNGPVQCVLVVEANADFFNLLLNFRKGLVIGGIASFVVLLILGIFLASAISLFLKTQENLRRSERLAAMGQMVATVAHEIRNPLSIIKNTAEVLRQRYDNKEKPDELFEFIPSEVRRLNRLVGDFLAFARDRELNLKRGDLIKTVKNAILLVRNEDHAAKVEWKFEPGQETILADLDDDAMMQVLINIFLNASQAMNGAGIVEINIEENRKAHERVHLSIKDHGPGLRVPADKIFEPFYTSKTHGSGLGLAISKQVIEKHHGRLEAESEKGKGTTMHIWLP